MLCHNFLGASASNSLTSSPPQVNGRITACVGDQISLICSRNNSDVALTKWMISSPVNCSSEVNHNSQTVPSPQCGPFTFQNITLVGANVVQLNSTAVATASGEINGSVIECMSGIVIPVSVGNISLCVIGKLNKSLRTCLLWLNLLNFFPDELPEPVNLRCMEVPHGLLVSWDVVTDGGSSCARSSIIHDITVVREADRMVIVSMNDVRDTQIEITNSLESSQNYSIQVKTKLIHGTCETGDITTACRISDDLSPTTASPDSPAPTTAAPDSPG